MKFNKVSVLVTFGVIAYFLTCHYERRAYVDACVDIFTSIYDGLHVNNIDVAQLRANCEGVADEKGYRKI